MAEVSRWLCVLPNSGKTSGISSSPSNITRNVTFTSCQVSVTHSSALKRDRTFKSIIPSLSFTAWQWSKTSYNTHQQLHTLPKTICYHGHFICKMQGSQPFLWIPLILESVFVATARGGRAHIKREKVIMDVSACPTSQRYGLRHLFITDSFSCCFVI